MTKVQPILVDHKKNQELRVIEVLEDDTQEVMWRIDMQAEILNSINLNKIPENQQQDYENQINKILAEFEKVENFGEDLYIIHYPSYLYILLLMPLIILPATTVLL